MRGGKEARAGTHVDVVDHVAGADLGALLHSASLNESVRVREARQKEETDGVEGNGDRAAVRRCSGDGKSGPREAQQQRGKHHAQATALRVLSMTDWW